MKSGILVIHKPKGMTSREVVNQVGKIFHTKKVGHMGTLDPLAEGVLVLGINQGTKVIELFSSSDKEYVAEAVMGISSDTLDIMGDLEKFSLERKYSEEEIRQVLESFLGTYCQEVPLYSAIHVDGKRLYEYARNEQEVKLPTKQVNIQEIKLIQYLQDEFPPTFTFQVSVSISPKFFFFKFFLRKEFYFRSLIRDIGVKLNCPSIMKNLLRTRQGKFLLEEAKKLEDLTEDTPFIQIEDALGRFEEYDTIVVSREMESKIQNGAILPRNFSGTYAIILNQEKELLAIYQRYIKDDALMKPWKVFDRR